MKVVAVLRDLPVEIEIDEVNGQVGIRAKGYGDHGSEDGYGSPILIEWYEGKLWVRVWPDINIYDPISIDIEGARETNRKEVVE